MATGPRCLQRTWSCIDKSEADPGPTILAGTVPYPESLSRIDFASAKTSRLVDGPFPCGFAGQISHRLDSMIVKSKGTIV